MEAKSKAKPKSKRELTQEKSKLANEIKSKKAEVDVLIAKIGDLEKLSNKKDSLQKEVDELTHTKRELGQLTVQQQTISKEVGELNAEKKKLNTYIKSNGPKKATLESELSELESRKEELEGKVEALLQNGKKAQSNVQSLKEEKEKYESSIAELKNDYGLFPRDLKEMSKDSVSQLKNYSLLAFLSILATVVTMAILVFVLTQPIIERTFVGTFSDQDLTFTSILISKILVFVSLVFFIILFVNITKGFVSQFIKVRNRLTSLRVADYLVDRIKSGKAVSNGQNGEVKDGASLLNSYIPKIMDLGSSPFERLSKPRKK